MKCRHVFIIEKFDIMDSHILQLLFDFPVVNIADQDSAGVRKSL